MKIRAATAHDLPAICDIHTRSWRIAYAGMLPDDFLGAPLEAWMADAWADVPTGEVLLLVAETSDIVGFACVRCDHPDGPLLDNLHVAQAAQGQGVGLALMQEAVKHLADMGKTGMWLEVLSGNISARRFYARLGGVEGSVFRDAVAGHPVPGHRVVWDGFEKILSAGQKS
ncbi:ribosomal-protein-alanine N-acetyltransferase [Falsiruegeria litorea R37]|uniref:Ribosomal-protein-alanine N-acetyltransferase n=1 Tax=Falsiruegeria litorea R37 TaxID=1200284 RepID=A0A1Y5SB48_9RHOB|nr:GNAT family N-acetyltransferase [Falsiruegeria litorea]SLN35952.1 ribosomal-protein-alanine N-acetyltransferase [Falsiruegeria litorea R37]